ncbi:efflux RND transporter permease subunit [Mucisphaera calidilacus]|uniref:Swarming motility protein SwrC n=1 Tax=Mucisphaera calidilacus TaxID=2527982 RepID=A0A518BU79_9BACT|nr:efflux RND transporter permease subunit [Mucisphaera calidilacus]QDU70542.1 Swarming motility protein SwrC [Mucisphaera calidilacus]
MNLPRFSVRRPVLVSMVALIVIVVGCVALSKLQIDLLPEVELPRLTVRTGYEDASPEVMERLVTRIVEEIVATVPGVEEMTSSSSEGNSAVRLTFSPDTDIDTAALDVQARLEDELNEFPDDIQRPRVSKFDIGSFPVVILGISSDLDPIELTELVENQIRYRFGRIPGVAQVDPWGGFNREIRIELDVDRVRALGLPLNDLLQTIRDANIDLPTGSINQGRYEVMLRAPAEFQSLDEIRDLVVATRDDVAVTLGQVATVKDTYERLTRLIRVNGKPGLRLAIRKESGANTVEVSGAILQEIERVARDFPQIEIVPVSNQGNFIERSIQNVSRSVLYGGLLAVLVLLYFLRDVRSTSVIALSIPISVLATLAVVYINGLTINLMTLGGLALGVGMMVDSSIVVLENIYRRRREESETPSQAAIRGTREVGTAIIASTITTLVVFLPIVFVEGVTGMLFKEFAYVVVIALLCSLAVALTLVPMLASRLMSSDHTETQTTRTRAGNGLYEHMLRTALAQRWLVLATAAGLVGLSVLVVPRIGSEFLPPSDEGEVRVTGEMEIGTRLDLVDRQTRIMEQTIVDHVPERIAQIASVGASGWRPDSGARGSIAITLMPSDQRSRSSEQIAQDLRQRLEGTIPGMTVRTRASQGQNLLTRILPDGGGISVEIRGFELDVLQELARQVAANIADIEGITDVDIGRRNGVPQEQLIIDRAKAADLGLSARRLAEVLETAISGRRAGNFQAQGNSYPIRVQISDAINLQLEEILSLTVRTPDGVDVALRNVLSVEPGRGPTVIDRKQQQRFLAVDLNVSERDMGSVAREIEQRLMTIPRPAGYDMQVAGSYREQQEAFAELLLSIALALALVYMVLASQYESLRDPFVVMLSVPLAAVGVLLTLYLTGTTLNIQSYIGCIMLGGIVVNNAILLVDQAEQLRGRGLSIQASALEAGRRRIRPILMTSTTTMLGLLPLAFGIGEGADAQAPLARAVIGGLFASMLITLIVVPVAYTLVHTEPEADRA